MQLPSHLSVLHTPYNHGEQLYVVAVIFNPLGFKSRVKLYHEFERYVEFSGAKLITVEIVLHNQPHVCTKIDNPWHLQLRTKHEMWHKERGLNLGIQHLLKLVPNAKNVAWIDADVRFSNPYWVHDTITALQHHAVVQMYSEAQSLNPCYESQWKTPGIFYNYCKKIGYHQEPPLPLSYTSGGHPGLAWAARVDILDKLGGLLDVCIHGSGDTHMANALMGNIQHGLRPGSSEQFQQALKSWADRCDRYVKKNIGFVHGICFHYWHGKPQQRGYDQRWRLICFHKFNPFEDIYPTSNGLYRFAGNKPHFEYDLKRSMTERNEDSVDA